MAIDAIRVSKTGMKPWRLHGPIDQALKTSCQANEVKAWTVGVPDVHGEPVQVELWVNTEERTSHEDEPNPIAQAILCHNELRSKGLSPIEAEAFGGEGLFDDLPNVLGVAVLTGLGGTDFPQDRPGCVCAALLDSHDKPEAEDFGFSEN